MVPNVVQDERAHDAGRVAHEAALVRKHGSFPVCHVEVGLVKQGRDPERQVGAPARKLAFGEGVQFPVKGREQRVGGGPVAGLAGGDEGGDRGCHGFAGSLLRRA